MYVCIRGSINEYNYKKKTISTCNCRKFQQVLFYIYIDLKALRESFDRPLLLYISLKALSKQMIN